MKFSRHTPAASHAMRPHGRGVAGCLCLPVGLARQVWVWGLMLTMLLSTLAPGVSRMLAAVAEPASGQGWVEVCTAQGMQWAHLEPEPGSGAGDSVLADLLHRLDACGHCALATDRGTPPPDFSGWGLSQPVPHALPALTGQGVPATPVRSPGARGPPMHA